MSLANFQRNAINSIRKENFKALHNMGWSADEKGSHIEVFDEDHKLVKKVFGHIELSRYLKD